MPGRKSNKIARLPTWELRLDVWFNQLKSDMHRKGVIDNIDISKTKLHDSMLGIEGIPDDPKTFTNWVDKSHYPEGVEDGNLKKLSSASPTSAQWLIPNITSPLQTFFLALDYYFCSVNSSIQPTLFKTSKQQGLAKQTLNIIAETWNIPFATSKEDSLFDQHLILDASLSMLKTHGYSAVPFYLSSLASNAHIPEDEVCDWYLDLLTSTLIVAANYHREKIELSYPLSPFSAPERFIDKSNFLGTSPNLLKIIGEFLFFEDSMPMLNFLNARHQDIDEINDSTKLLEGILMGSVELKKQLKNIGIEYSQITTLMQSQLKTTENSYKNFIQRSNKDSINSIRDFQSSRAPENIEPIIYHLYPEDPIRVEKETASNKEIIACRYPNKANDSHYSWGYGGTGVSQMAYTLLYDLFNHRALSREEVIPNHSEVELVMFKLLSRIHNCFRYSISSSQIIKALQTEIKKEPNQIDNDIVLKFCSVA